MEETEETGSDGAQFPRDFPGGYFFPQTILSMSVPSSSSPIPTETYSVSQNANQTTGEEEGKLVEGQNSSVRSESDSSAVKVVSRSDVVMESHSGSNGNVGPSTSKGQVLKPSHSHVHESGEGSSIRHHPDFRSQRSSEVPAPSRFHNRAHEDGSLAHFGASSTHAARSSKKAVPISSAHRVKLFVVVPKSVEDVTIQLDQALHLKETSRADLSLGKGTDGRFSVFSWKGEVKRLGEMSAVYQILIDEDDHSGSQTGDISFFGSIKNRVVENMLGGRMFKEVTNNVKLPNHRVHVDVCGDQGTVKHPREYILVEWLAVLMTLIAATDKSCFGDIAAEYFHKRPNQLVHMLSSEKQLSSESLKAVYQWASHLQEEVGRGFESPPVAEQGLISVALLEILVAFQTLPRGHEVKGKELARVFLEILLPLGSYFQGFQMPGFAYLEHEGVRQVLQITMSNFLCCISPFTFEWVDHLEPLSFFDPTLQFLNEWRPFRFGDMDYRDIVNTARKQYEDAIRKLCSKTHLFRSSAERSTASGYALQAAPTIREYFQATHYLVQAGWLLGDDLVATHDMNLMNESLGKCFSKITEEDVGQRESPGIRKASLQRQLELALSVEAGSVYPFLAASFRDHLIEVFREFLLSDDESQGFIRDALSLIKSRSASVSDLFLSLVTSPHAFNSPLRSPEVRLISFLSSIINSKTYAFGRAAIVSLTNLPVSYAEYREVLQVWIQGAARRKFSGGGSYIHGGLLPHCFVAGLEELLVAGMKPSFASPLSEMAMSMAVDECPSLPAFLHDSKQVTIGQASKVVQNYYLEAAGSMMEAVLSEASQTRGQFFDSACASLRAICQETSRGDLEFQNSIGEHLCIKLLDTIVKACSTLLEELELRPIDTLMEFKFATLLMKIEECPANIESHVLYKEIQKACVTLGGSLQSGSVTLGYINSSFVSGDWQKIFQIMGNGTFVAAVEKAHKDLLGFKKRLEGFKVIVYNICPFLSDHKIAVERYTEWRDWFEERSSQWENFTLNEIHVADHWPAEVHRVIYDSLDPLLTLHGSRIFLNILLESVPGHARRTSPCTESEPEVITQIALSTVASVVFPQAMLRYEEEMLLFVAPDISFDWIIMERVRDLLNGVFPSTLESEFECARTQLGWSSTKMHDFLKLRPEKGTNIVEYLELWKGIDVLRQLHTILPLVASVFELNKDCDGLVQRIWNVTTECTPQCSLRRFQEVLQEDGRNVLTHFSTSEVDVLGELTQTGPLIMFLKESVQEDLRHLLDAVEDPNASQTWEGHLNDLIDLQRIFRPLLSATTFSFDDLRSSIVRELKASSSNSNHLCKKLKACNKEAHSLRQYFLGVANRMYKDNDQIAEIVRSGKYYFSLNEEGCFLELKCSASANLTQPQSSESSGNTTGSSQGGRSYTLAQLQELRSRARWTISSNSYVKKSKTAQTLGADWVGTDEETIDTTEKCAVVFISHIDLAEKTVAILTELYNCGHFSFANFEREISGFANLLTMTDFLKSELATWNAALLRARNKLFYLNYFRSAELRLILQVLLPKLDIFQPAEKLEHCLDLFKWAVGSSIDLKHAQIVATAWLLPEFVTKIIESTQAGKENCAEHKKGDVLYQCFRAISGVMESGIYTPRLARQSLRNSSATKTSRQRIILADVDDPLGELDAVATLFSERDLLLHENARNVIVCGPLTAWEDLYLLILRCLKNSGLEKNYFYCIVYVERLSFDCQAQLTTFLQDTFLDHESCENDLALVSCSRSGFLHSLSQRIQIQVRHMAAGTPGAIGTKENGRYSRMWVITSDLPGMGKTTSVRTFADANYRAPIKTLTICGEVSRSLLIQRMKGLFKRPSEMSNAILHLDISVVSNPETLNDLLFELLILGCLKSDRAGVFHLETNKVAIEVANTYHNYLASKLPVIKWFRTKHLVWNMEKCEFNHSITSDDQLVCNYLRHLLDGDVAAWNPDGKDPSRSVVAMSNVLCRELLQIYFVQHLKDPRSMSFSLLQNFMKFFAQQLREFTACPFFVPENLTFMRALASTRLTMVGSILQVSRDLCIRSVKPWLDEQQQDSTMDASHNAEVLMTARMDNMLRWSDSKHVMIFFQLTGRMSILYKDRSQVPPALLDLFNKQKAKLPNYESLSSAALHDELWPLLCRSQPPARDSLYVLTADNFLKMALIFTKVKASVPVVIMGETGCGKTSLLRQLAHYCSVTFLSITLHAGTTEDGIRAFLLEAKAQASKHVVWAFLDEINACDHLGFLVPVVCHHLLDGRPLHPNLKILSACNPYRKHDSRKHRAGLSTRKTLKSSNHLNMAYTVHPLPEALVENVQDFGILNVKDEQLYTQAIVSKCTRNEKLPFPFVELLVMSQAFMRETSGEASVSLRDIRRCVDLFLFFSQDLENRSQGPNLSEERRGKRAALLAFAHCYYYRLASEEDRSKYKAKFVVVMNGNSWRLRLGKGAYTATRFDKELHDEQMELLGHMEIPPGIAKNQALRENVFVTLTCILQKIPLFVVGKPGSGKTLSLQLIFSNLRGSGMKDPYFRQKPTMFMFSYQGSESSTSEGILKVFEKAYRCVEDNKKKNVKAVVVVVLDEVGLAEISSHNPLKVLHSLLEPDGEQQVAVVGISNWSLDAAKMNRAIHISQPDPSVSDLVATGEAILDSYGMRKIYGDQQITEMNWLAKVYHDYHVRQSKPDFHGLRDYYSLIKSLRGDEKVPKKWSADDLRQAVWRNFGGSPDDTELLLSILGAYFGKLRFEPPPALELVKANLEDTDARHLMLISTGESGVGILENMLPRKEKLIMVHGSKFKDDCSDDYAYLILSNIILHMEHGRHILLKGVERVWSSLYDMLNQHYTIVAGRRNCRIAIGAFSNPMCYVHHNFRCIVVVDQTQVQSLDPPFLNRFEKQVLTWEALLSPQQLECVAVLRTWVRAMACTSGEDDPVEDMASFSERDLIPGYSADTLASLVLKNWDTDASSKHEDVLERCKEDLLLTAYPDGMIRAHYSSSCLRGAPDAKLLTSAYFQKRSDQESLSFTIRNYIAEKSLWQDDLGFKLVLTTRSSVHTNIKLLLKGLHYVHIQVIRLGDFTAERQLIAAIQQWSKSTNGLLIIQSDTVLDKDHLPLAKVHVERTRADLSSQSEHGHKHVLFILHDHSGIASEEETASPFTFLSGWKQITLDKLHLDTDYREYLDKSIPELFQSEKFRDSHNLMVKVLTWSFLCIKYPRGRESAAHCKEMVLKICNDRDLCDCFVQRAVIWLEEDAKKEAEAGKVWQTAVVCNRGRLVLASNLHSAFSQYIEEKLREPIARLVYVLESISALGSYFNMADGEKDLWRAVFMDRKAINIDNVPQPTHPEGYIIKDPMNLKVPFSSLYVEYVENYMRELFLSRVADLPSMDDARAVALAVEMAKDVTSSLQSDESMRRIEECAKANPHDYYHDYAVLKAPYRSTVRSAAEGLVFEWLLRENVPELNVPLQLHALVWRKSDTLKAQALLASTCYKAEEVATEVDIIKRFNSFTKDFDLRFSSQCVQKMMPSETTVCYNAGGWTKWLHQFGVLIKLVSSMDNAGCPSNASIMLMLHVLHDYARMVIQEVASPLAELMNFSSWCQRQNLRPSPQSLITKISSLLPVDVNELQGSERNTYFRFVTSTFSRCLDNSACVLSQDAISAMSVVIFGIKSPTCLMKGLMLRLLRAAGKLLIPTSKPRCPLLLELSFRDTSSLIDAQSWKTSCPSSIILFCDVICDSLRPVITAELLSGQDTEAFSYENFRIYLKWATEELTRSSETLRMAGSFALLRTVMEILSRDFVTIQTKEPGIFNPRLDPVISETLCNFFRQRHHNVMAMQQYVMKVLRYHHGFSIHNISCLAHACKTNELSQLLYSLILDWNLFQAFDNPLGFNPFTTIFPLFSSNDELLWSTFFADSERVQKLKVQIQTLSSTCQGSFACAVANRFFMVKPSRDLLEREVDVANWLREEGSLKNWDKRWQSSIRCLVGEGEMQVNRESSSKQLQFKALGAHILLLVSSFGPDSPFQGYLELSEAHLLDAYVLCAPDNLISSVRNAVQSKEKVREYVHNCGFVYVIGNCTMASQRAKCPGCGGSIGGIGHRLDPNNTVFLQTSETIEKGYIADQVPMHDTYYTVRKFSPLAYRVLRIIVHYCILLGLYAGRRASKRIIKALEVPPRATGTKELENLIESDLRMLGMLLGGNFEFTSQYMHAVLASLPGQTLKSAGLLSTNDQRRTFEEKFQAVINSERHANQLRVTTYLEEHRGQHMLTEILEERRLPPFQGASAGLTRISAVPSFDNFRAVHMQDETRRNLFPIVERFFNHMNELSEMKHLLDLVRFSKAVHEHLASRITRPEAGTMSIGQYFRSLTAKERAIKTSFPAFARAWNVMRLKVTAFECTEFKQGIPEMNESVSIGFCLVEPRDLGIYLAAILDHLRAIQNGFLNDVADGDGAAENTGNRPSVKVLMCKAEDVVDFDEQWPHQIVFDAAMASLEFSQGQIVFYDDYSIAEHLRNRLVDQKPNLDQWDPFLYKHEAFHKHMTILSEVTAKIPQSPLGSETLQAIQKEISLSTVGPGSYLSVLDLCLGFLCRTGGSPTEPLHSYSQRWLGDSESHPLVALQTLPKVELQHVVSLYEGLEDSASVRIEGLVNVRYRTELSPALVEELRASVEVKRRPGQTPSNHEGAAVKIDAKLFSEVLRRFMFRYLIGDQLNAEVQLSTYIMDERLARWPEDVVDDVYDVFPNGLLAKHSHATYLYLGEILGACYIFWAPFVVWISQYEHLVGTPGRILYTFEIDDPLSRTQQGGMSMN